MTLLLRSKARDVPVAIAAILVEVATQCGMTPAQVFDGSAIEPQVLADPHQRIANIDYERLLANCLQGTQRPEFALLYGSRISVVALGALGYALMCCRDLRELLGVFSRYVLLVSSTFQAELIEQPNGVSLRLRGGVLHTEAEAIDCELFFAAASYTLRQLTGGVNPITSVSLVHSDPGYAAAYRDFICDQVWFDQPANEIRLDQTLLDMPLQFANPALLAIYRDQCDLMLKKQRANAGPTGAVRAYLLEKPGYIPSFDATAEHFHLSPRTLRRRLAEDGTTFQAIVAELRRELAEQWLRETTLSVEGIAAMLGYRDVSNFRRAFISWNGLSPAQYRQRWLV